MVWCVYAGTGKTLVARAVATESGMRFISVKVRINLPLVPLLFSSLLFSSFLSFPHRSSPSLSIPLLSIPLLSFIKRYYFTTKSLTNVVDAS